MTFALSVRPDAEAEIDEASRWYEADDPEVGQDFLRAVDEALALIKGNPYQYQIAHNDKRRARLRRFPYRLIYAISGQDVVVLACVHGRRDPKVWEDRTS